MDSILVNYLADAVREKAPLRPARPGDAGMDLVYHGDDPLHVPIGRSVMVPSGLCVKVPEGCVGFIRSRSSTFMKKGLFVVEGVIDSGYTGPLYTIVWNPGVIRPVYPQQPVPGLSLEHEVPAGPIVLNPWDRVSQLIVVPFRSEVLHVSEMPTTERGGKGFGSTGG